MSRNNLTKNKSHVNELLDSRKEGYLNVAEDLFSTGFMPFLPYDDKLNLDGDKYSTKKEVGENIGLLAASLDEGVNYFQERYDLTKEEGKTSKEKLSEIGDKVLACDNLLSLESVQGKAFSDTSTVGKSVIKPMASSIPLEDSQFVASYIDDVLDRTFNTIYNIADNDNDNDRITEKAFEKDERQFLIGSVTNAMRDVKKEYITSINEGVNIRSNKSFTDSFNKNDSHRSR